MRLSRVEHDPHAVPGHDHSAVIWLNFQKMVARLFHSGHRNGRSYRKKFSNDFQSTRDGVRHRVFI